jgi:hypothetical protein
MVDSHSCPTCLAWSSPVLPPLLLLTDRTATLRVGMDLVGAAGQRTLPVRDERAIMMGCNCFC